MNRLLQSTMLASCLLVLFLSVPMTNALKSDLDASSLKLSKDLLKMMMSTLKVKSVPSAKTESAYSSGGGSGGSVYVEEREQSPFIQGINAFVDALGNVIYAILQTLGLIDAREQYQHYYFSDQCRYYK